MRAVRVRLSSWTASFRYAGFMIGVQPSLPMPPLSTIYGLLSAAVGRIVTPNDTFVGYTFHHNGKTMDLERILEVEPGRGGKWNVIRREILLDAHLNLYLDPKMHQYFERPHYPLLLGRSSDLATVDAIEEVRLTEVSNEKATFGESIFTKPPQGFRIATMYALPVYFTETIPREAIGTRPFTMISERYVAEGNGMMDEEDNIAFEIHSARSLGLRTAE